MGKLDLARGATPTIQGIVQNSIAHRRKVIFAMSKKESPVLPFCLSSPS